jgi:basic membrane protein A
MVTLGDGPGAISAVGGEQVPSVQRFIAGYQAGAASAAPEVAVLIGYTHNFLDPAKGKAVALSQIARGSRVVFQVASRCGLGALEAAREQDVWGIGVDGDQSSLGPHVLTSAVKHLDVAVFTTIDEFDRGTLQTGGTSAFSLRNGAVGLGAFSPVVPESVREELAAVETAIAAGSITIPASP